MIVTGSDGVGAAIAHRLISEGKSGLTRGNGAGYDMWWNGGLRNSPYFHNIIGLLTEIIGSPTPFTFGLYPGRLVRNNDNPLPAPPQVWHYRKSIEYMVSINYAVLDYAARHRDELLFNIYRMGRDSIERGSKDTWTDFSSRVTAMNAAWKQDPRYHVSDLNIPEEYYNRYLRQPSQRDARAYIIPSTQPDFPTAVKFVNALIRTGVRVEQASSDFEAGGKSYRAGSYIVQTNQAFRPQVLDMFEPQDYPSTFEYPGGPPVPPWVAAGWTLAFEMGVKFDRVLEPVTAPLNRIPYGMLQHAPSQSIAATEVGWTLSPSQNDTFTVVNRLMAAGLEVDRLPNHDFFVPGNENSSLQLQSLVSSFGVSASVVDRRPRVTSRLKPLRIALWDIYGGSITSGWIRWLFDQIGFSYKVVGTPEIEAGNLRENFDLLLFPSGAMTPSGNGLMRASEVDPKTVPEQYRGLLSDSKAEVSLHSLQAFLNEGGSVIALGSSTSMATTLGLPVTNLFTESTTPQLSEYFIPASLLRAKIAVDIEAGAGMEPEADVCFESGRPETGGYTPVFKLNPEASARGVKKIAWFDEAPLLRSGWALGEERLRNTTIALEAPVGTGKVFLFSPQIVFRGQSHGTYKLLFNCLYGTDQ